MVATPRTTRRFQSLQTDQRIRTTFSAILLGVWQRMLPKAHSFIYLVKKFVVNAQHKATGRASCKFCSSPVIRKPAMRLTDLSGGTDSGGGGVLYRAGNTEVRPWLGHPLASVEPETRERARQTEATGTCGDNNCETQAFDHHWLLFSLQQKITNNGRASAKPRESKSQQKTSKTNLHKRTPYGLVLSCCV